MKRKFTLFAVALMALSANAQQLREGYIRSGENTSSEQFHTLLQQWRPGFKISDDENFYISRVKPKKRFRNTATQVRQNLTDENDKKLLAWLPIGGTSSGNPWNALPNGVFDSEVFSMWQYVTYWGNWSAPVGRIPAAFLDVAHKNGVGASGVASVPFGGLQTNWQTMIEGLVTTDISNDAKFFKYYGIDGMGWNSEFYAESQLVSNLRNFHGSLHKAMVGDDPLFMNLWYDGTNDYGNIDFDRGLNESNIETFGNSENIRTSLFSNYNWNRLTLQNSVDKALEVGRDPLDYYLGVNMQGGEPRRSPFWTKIGAARLSIGLWGAHSDNMFWEGRGEKGSDPVIQQATYLQRIERYFTGGTRNPVNCPQPTDVHNHSADNFNWMGMSTWMTAKSVLSWDLAEEPFITYFNLGNGKFFNLKGERQNSVEWYNIGMQDYLPTWRWWFTTSFLGTEATDVPTTGLDANFTWDDAWFGGSTIRITGSTTEEYLHLFKTKFDLKTGDKVTFRYKLEAGSADVKLVLAQVSESDRQRTYYDVVEAADKADNEVWIEKSFTVGEDMPLDLVALRFNNASGLSLLLGELSIVRATAETPSVPSVTSSAILYNSCRGMDGKIIFDMQNDKQAGEPVYNLDVKTSFFKLWAQEEGQEKPVLMGTTTSWAGLMFSIPIQKANSRVRLGVSAVGLDHKAESTIAWSEYMTPSTYIYNDDIEVSKTTIKPNEKFVLQYVDPEHEPGTWTLKDVNGATVFTGEGRSVEVNGLENIGSYELTIVGNEYAPGSTDRTQTSRTYGAFVQVTSEGTGALPEIYTLTANGKDADITVEPGDKVEMAYTGRHADGAGSQGIDLNEMRFGARCADLGVTGETSFSVAFWLKINKLAAGETQLLSVANKRDSWPKTDWGWIWANIKDDGSIGSFTFRGTDATSNNELRYKFANTHIPVGSWVHIAFTFDWQNSGFRGRFYVNGQEQELTAWNRSKNTIDKTTDPGYQGDVYRITNGQVLAVGGSAAGRNGIDGTLDNLQVWNKVMTGDEVKQSMGDLDKDNLPEGLAYYWDIEDKASSDNTFLSVGHAATSVMAGAHTYKTQGGEGQGVFQWMEPEYTSGCPFIAGTAFPVVTLPTWNAPKAEITNAEGNSEAGKATLTYDKDDVRTVTLTLANSLGSDTKTFSLITIGNLTGIDEVTTDKDNLKAYIVGETAIVEFAEPGNYTVSVYNVNGQAEASSEAIISSGQTMRVHMAKAGVYVLSVKKDGKTVKAVKLLRK